MDLSKQQRIELVDRYRRLNESFAKTLVFHVGYDAGFFSEINNMVLAMVYCLRYKIKFTLYSADANFGYDKGWQDVFLPFCPEYRSLLHGKINKRWLSERERHSIKSKIKYWIGKRLLGVRYLTQDLWNDIRNQSIHDEIDLPELDLKGDLKSVAGELARMIWRPIDKVQQIVARLRYKLALPNNFVGIHIRSGDKIKEHSLYSVSDYINKAASITNLRQCFILTDDFRIVEAISIKWPEWTVYTLCQSEEKGYDHKLHTSLSKNERFQAIIRLITSVEILSSSELVIGTFSTNPGMFLGMVMPRDKFIGIDSERWMIW